MMKLEMPEGAENASKRFFTIYFRWFWTFLRVSWTLIWLGFAVCLMFIPTRAYVALLAFPISFAFGLIVSWTYMPLALQRYKVRSGL